MTHSIETRSCEWCDSKEGLIEAPTSDGTKLLVCKDGYACGERWPDVAPVGRVGCYEGSVG